MSKFQIKKYMIKKKLIKCSLSSFDRVIDKYKEGSLPADLTWECISKRGRKRYLSNDNVDEVLSSIMKKYDGGHSLGIDELRTIVKKEIETSIDKKTNGSKNLPPICVDTINHYVNMIKGKPNVNIVSNVAGKTESRITAEWSVRSTINYMVAVATTHFFQAEGTVLHPLKKRYEQ